MFSGGMATRDLTDHFVRQRSALHRKVPGGPRGDDFGGSGLLGSAGGSGNGGFRRVAARASLLAAALRARAAGRPRRVNAPRLILR